MADETQESKLRLALGALLNKKPNRNSFLSLLDKGQAVEGLDKIGRVLLITFDSNLCKAGLLNFPGQCF